MHNKLIDLYQLSSNERDFEFLEYLFDVSKNDEFLHFWNKHHQYFMNESTLRSAFFFRNPSNINFMKWLYEQGVPSEYFNVPDVTGRTSLQKIARIGDIELFNRIAKDIPQDQIKLSSDLAFEEEIRDCFIREEIDLSRFDPNKIMIAQNGCRTVVMTDEGEIFSYPGQDASRIAKQISNGTDLDSFMIYHNSGHASIAFSEAHYGFYPFNNLDVANVGLGEAFFDGLVRNGMGHGIAQGGTISGATVGTQPGSSSFNNMGKSKLAFSAPVKIWESMNLRENLPDMYESLPCMVIDDSPHKAISDETNGLTLRVYAPKDKVEAVRQYAAKIQDGCKAGNATLAYHLITNNCIDFVKKAVQASGTKADFRDSFHTMQYLRRGGAANIYTMFRSNQPMFQSNTSLLDAKSISGAVDLISRNTVLGTISSLPGMAYAYLVYKSIPTAIATASLAGSRLSQAAISIAGYTTSIGAIFQARAFRNG